MIGSQEIRIINGEWDHVGYCTTEHVTLGSGVVLPRGTNYMFSPTNDEKWVLASGDAVGFGTQEVDYEGQTSLDNRLRITTGIGSEKGDWPIRIGQALSVRRMNSFSAIQVEGLGASIPGNIVCTTGTGSLSSATARGVELSVFNGCWRIAQSGDFVLAKVLLSNITPEIVGRLRLLIEYVGKYKKA